MNSAAQRWPRRLAAIGQLRAGFDALLAVNLDAMSAPELTAVLDELETECRRRAAVDHRLIAAVVERNIAGDYGATSPAALLVQLLRISPAEAKARVARARDLGPRRVPSSGELLDPILPIIAAAQQAGDISTEHASVIVKAVEAIPDRLAAQFTELVETTLVDVARHRPSRPGRQGRVGSCWPASTRTGWNRARKNTNARRDFGIRDNRDGSAPRMGGGPRNCAR